MYYVSRKLMFILVILVAGLFSIGPAMAAQQAQYASGWSVKNNADWTPFPSNSDNPLGAPDDNCTGGAIPTSWAEFTFPAFSIPPTDVVTGIEFRVKLLSPSGSNTMHLTTSPETLVGIPQTLLGVSNGRSGCSSTSFVSAGSNGNLWGTTLTPADFNAASIGVRLTQNSNTIEIDAIELVVYHDDSGVTLEADLAISKTDGLSFVNQGGQLVYTISASNNGPNDVAAALVTDDLPAALSCTWTCLATSGSYCSSGPATGNINELVDIIKDGIVTFTSTCDVASGASGTLVNTAIVSIPPADLNDPNPGNNSATDITEVNEAPVAQCQDATVIADAASCTAAASINDGSFDPNDDPITLTQSPSGPYSLGDTTVSLEVTDVPGGLTASCLATVSVIDNTPPVLACNSPATIIPPDAPIAFSASATDSCGAVTTAVVAYDCYKFTKKGKRIDKTESCVVGLAGDTVTISDSGGVGTTIEWTVVATDDNGNDATNTCSLVVANPGKHKKR